MTASIYSLHDPRDGLVRYIGKTVNSPESRFKAHIREGGATSSLMRSWINELKSLSLIPELHIVAKCEPSKLDELEMFYIAEHRSIGFDLFNILRGGDGATLESYTEDVRLAMSASAKARFQREGERERNRIAQVNAHKNPETREKNRKKAIARMSSKEAREVVSADRKKFFSLEENRKRQSQILREFHKANPDARELARQKTIQQFSDPAARELASQMHKKYNAEHPNKNAKQWKAITGVPKSGGDPVQYKSLHDAAKSLRVSVGAIFNSLKFGGCSAGYRFSYSTI